MAIDSLIRNTCIIGVYADYAIENMHKPMIDYIVKNCPEYNGTSLIFYSDNLDAYKYLLHDKICNKNMEIIFLMDAVHQEAGEIFKFILRSRDIDYRLRTIKWAIPIIKKLVERHFRDTLDENGHKREKGSITLASVIVKECLRWNIMDIDLRTKMLEFCAISIFEYESQIIAMDGILSIIDKLLE